MRKISYDEGVVYSFRPDLEPVLTITSGETVEFVCQDACGGRIRSETDTLDRLDAGQVNGATGPVGVSDARPGDVLRVKILDVRVKERGFVSIAPGYGVLGEEVKAGRTRMVPIRDGRAHFSPQLEVPVRPHVGTIGVAPVEEEWSTFYPGDHGGNLDTKEIAKGNAVHLPVFQQGAQLAMGDLHAVMADGEVCVTGVEVEGTVRVRVDVQPDRSLKRPLVETPEAWMTVASAPTLEEAVRDATHDGVELLARQANLSWEEAYMLASLVCDLRISQVVDPWPTVRLVVPKSFAGRGAPRDA